ncbi:hypothetical protein [Rhodanobacter sp. C01]|uniref:hypothetical protein n=1 Tax=Rhodanobacter sp. C01 TaxID=1945856 RepID=UPI000986BD94|nr:hypothetical protein [Rhodanobacter sp. C01]OOG50932.1 hypothetical protein B0E50_01705 [Rhodanobacter sp. C01]
MKTWIAVELMLALAAGTVAAKDVPKVPDMQSADFCAYPNDVEELLKAWAETTLKDFDSARHVHVSKPRKEWAVEQQQPIYRWSVRATITPRIHKSDPYA